MEDVWLLILAVIVLYGFWLDRKIAEVAKQTAQRECDKLSLQLLSVACKRKQIRLLSNGKPGFKTEFEFEFSSTGNDSYTGMLYFEDTLLKQSWVPPHKV